MYFSRLRLTRQGLSLLLSGSEYGLHRALWTLFADRPDRERDFLYRRMNDGTQPEFLCLSARPPVGDGRWNVETKPFAPRFLTGQRLEFSLRANPVRTHWVDGKQKRRDVVMDAKTRLKAQDLPRDQWPTSAAIIQEAGAAWIEERAERWGVSFESGSIFDHPGGVIGTGHLHFLAGLEAGKADSVGLGRVFDRDEACLAHLHPSDCGSGCGPLRRRRRGGQGQGGQKERPCAHARNTERKSLSGHTSLLKRRVDDAAPPLFCWLWSKTDMLSRWRGPV